MVANDLKLAVDTVVTVTEKICVTSTQVFKLRQRARERARNQDTRKPWLT